MVSFIRFFYWFYWGLASLGDDLINFLNSYPSIGDVRLLDYTYSEILFGPGLIVFISFAAVKFIVDIVS